MPEGPSLILFREELLQFKGKKVVLAAGNTKINKERLVNKKILDMKTWGKHLLLCFDSFTIRIHFLMFGTYYINSEKDAVPRLHLEFAGGTFLNLYSCGVKMVEEPLEEIYDWAGDVLHDSWNPRLARKKLKLIPDTMVTDALLDQTIFSGVGNIIKNEVLYRIRVHPESLVGALPPAKFSAMIREARNYSHEFLAWKREFTLRQHWLVHTKKICQRDQATILKAHLGKTDRRTFFCPVCQKLYV